MFIPINIRHKEYKKDDIVVSIKEIVKGYGLFTIGHEFTVIEKVPRYSYYTLIDNENNIIIKKIEPKFFTFKTKINEAKQIYVDIFEKNKAIRFIQNNCPHKGHAYDDRDRYDSCELKNIYTGNECNCKLSCVYYIDKNKIDQNDFMKVYMRKIKIKDIIK